MITSNPADAVEVPRPGRRDIQTLSPEECARLLEALEGDPLRPLYLTAMLTGLRQS